MKDFTRAAHTFIVSDIHLADAEPPHPHNPLWKRFKRPAHFIDRQFRDFLAFVVQQSAEPTELILDGDIFDFDSVMAMPPSPEIHVNWLERLRGLSSEEVKSRFKIQVILRDHKIWVEAMREFVAAGNRVIFIVGNHDVEMNWPSVQQEILKAIAPEEHLQDNVRFCEWFYISNQDTLVEHGHQYDAYSLVSNPINPLIRKGHKVFVRIPFGNLAGKYILNGIGLMNPHANSSYIKSSFREYLEFYYRYVMRTQPLLLWTWFWGALVTLVYSVTEGLLPAMTDPLTIASRVEDIASRANAKPGTVWSLKEMHVHPAIYNPFKILRELWLDRALVLGLICFVSWQFFAFLHIFVPVSYRWFLIPLVLLMPVLIFYSRSVVSDVDEAQRSSFHMAPLSARIAGVRRVVNGHTHLEMHTSVKGVDYLNTGTWSPAYHDVECTQPYGRKCFAWIRPAPAGGSARIAELYEWKDGQVIAVPCGAAGEPGDPQVVSAETQPLAAEPGGGEGGQSPKGAKVAG